MKKIIIIYGPTGSGKTQLASILASKFDYDIINADSMQVYKEIEILNASPSKEDKNLTTHSLFNFFSIYKNYSLDLYINDVKNILENNTNKNYIIVGGTGMYINALLQGMKEIPTIPEDIRVETKERFFELGNIEFYKELIKLDPEIIDKIHCNNSHRLMRAYEVKKFTGYSIYDANHSKQIESILNEYKIIKIYLNPERCFLYKLCNKRFDKMIKNGAIEEVESIANDYQNLSLSVKKIIGLEEIYQYINGKNNIEDMISIAQQRTRNYAKRQFTWFSNQITHDYQVNFSSSNEYEKEINNIQKHFNEFLL